MPLFSIIIPTYNAASTIEKALSSVINQFFTDFEILVVDGASQDATIFKIQGFADQNARIKYFFEKDRGIYDAMNKGIELAKGDYLYFLGSDDVLYNEQVLQEVAEEIKENIFPDFIYGNVLLGVSNKLYDGEFCLRKLYDINISHQSIFYKKTVFDKLGKFDLQFPALADWHFNFKCFVSRNIQITYIPQIIARFAPGGLSSYMKDPLYHKKENVFSHLVEGAHKTQYHLLKKHIADKKTVPGKIGFIYHQLAYQFFLTLQKLSGTKAGS